MTRRNHPSVDWRGGDRNGKSHERRVARAPFVVLSDDDEVNATPPAVVLTQSKFIVNVASMIRNCACFGVEWLVLTGDRLDIPSGRKGDRLPRQERMREYETVKVVQTDFPTVLFKRQDITPIGIELVPGAIPLPMVKHPENAVYLLGPEDGSLSPGYKALCHEIWRVPTRHCLNVAQAGGIVLYDRVRSLWEQHHGDLPELAEARGFDNQAGSRVL
jgi:tRNA G18 (ribose-2'-O)-methylase SpoU